MVSFAGWRGASGVGVACSCMGLPPRFGVVDPHEPPMPPEVTSDQAMKFAEALAKGTPHAGRIALTMLSDQVRELI